MKPQIIEAADGTQWEKVDNDNGIVPKEPGVFRHFIFKRLPPRNPMPELKVGYMVEQRLCSGRDVIIEV